MMRRVLTVFFGVAMALSACAEPPTGGATTTTQAAAASTSAAQPVALPDCMDIEAPSAPDDWYADTPIYVGDEAPWEEVRTFAATLDGFLELWEDDHNGWIAVGFHDADVVAHQAALEAEFPGVGVVAVELPYTSAELTALATQVATRLPDGMAMSGIIETDGIIQVSVWLLTPENIAAATVAAGAAPVCLTGRDPATTPLPGPQPAGGEDWSYLLEVDGMPGSEASTWVEDPAALAAVLEKLAVNGEPPAVDFEKQIVLVLVRGYSGSCPVTRLDDILVEGDLVYGVIPTIITDEVVCFDDWNPRTYLAAVDRDLMPPPPLRVGVTETPAPPQPARQASHRPYIIEPTYPWPLVLDVDCGVEYLGEINGVHWHRSDGGSGLPSEWDRASVDGLLDLTLLMTEGPEPTLTASAAGVDVSYLPGPEAEMVCG